MAINDLVDPRSKEYKMNGLYFSQKIVNKKISDKSRDPLFESYREFNYLINAYKSPKTISNPTKGMISKIFDLGDAKITSYVDTKNETFNVELVYKDNDVKDLIDIILKYFKNNNLFVESKEKINEFKKLYSNKVSNNTNKNKYTGTNDDFNKFSWNGFTILKLNPEIKENAYRKEYPNVI